MNDRQEKINQIIQEKNDNPNIPLIWLISEIAKTLIAVKAEDK